MKERFLKLVPLIVLIVAFIDTNYDLLQSVGIPTKLIDWIKLLGLFFVAYAPSIKAVFNKKQYYAETENEDDEDIIGNRPKDR